jgi:hypothetical protein
MADDTVEMFEVGNTVWVKPIEGEHEKKSEKLFYILGTGPYYVDEVELATTFPFKRFHPQVLHLRDVNGELVQLFFFDVPFSGMWFTKTNPQISKGVLSAEVAQRGNDLIDKLRDRIMELIAADPHIAEMYEKLKGDQLSVKLSFVAQLIKLKCEFLVKDGVVTFSKDEEDALEKILHMDIKLEE